MKRLPLVFVVAVLTASCSSTRTDPQTAGSAESKNTAWQDTFDLSRRSLSPTGQNPYFILEPGYRLVLKGGDETVTITVLDETKQVAGVATRVVEERELKNGKLAEVSRNYYAICRNTKDVFYFGEDVDIYRNGVVTGHSGAWSAGEKNAKPGLMMPGKPAVGMKHYQEVAPGVALDRAEILSLTHTLKTPAGTFTNCLRAVETSGLDSHEKCFKTYAPGVGLIQDADLVLVRRGFLGG